MKGFTLIELLAVVIILAVVALIATPIISDMLDEARVSSNMSQAKLLLDGAEKLYSTSQVSESNFDKFNGYSNVYDLITVSGKRPEHGKITITNEGQIDFAVYIDEECYAKSIHSITITVREVDSVEACVGVPEIITPTTDDYDDLTITSSNSTTDTGRSYSITMTLKNDVNSYTSVKYIINRDLEKIGVSSDLWDKGSTFDEKTEVVNISGDNLQPGTYYTHVLVNKNGVSKEYVSSKTEVKINNTIRTERLGELLTNVEESYTQTLSSDLPIALDFLQMWFVEYDDITSLTRKLEVLKRAGYEGIIIQDVLSFSTNSSNVVTIDKLNHPSSLTQYIDGDTTVDTGQLIKVIEAATALGLDFYFGTGSTDEWWLEEKYSNPQWNSNVTNFTIDLIDELYSLYGNNPHFKGWYWSNEMHTTNNGAEVDWVTQLAPIVDHLNSMPSRKTFMISPFISSVQVASLEEIRNQWQYIIDNVAFQAGDIINFQDGFGTAEYKVDFVFDVHTVIKDIISTKPGLKMYLNIENFSRIDEFKAVNSDRFVNQLDLAKYLADGLTSFSYIYYYNPFQSEENKDAATTYDIAYRKHLDMDTKSDGPIYGVPTPINGSVFKDSNGDDAPIPAGFTVSSNEDERIVKNGLVIKDNYGNEFVWIPTYYGIVASDYEYKWHENKYVGYINQYTNGYVNPSYSTVSLPIGSEYDQINKYHGFYIARYESSFYMKNNVAGTQSKPTSVVGSGYAFYPDYADISYNGYLNTNVGITKAISMADNMSSVFNYDNSIKTSLVTGQQWDTVVNWLGRSGYGVNDARNWGNYIDAIENATTGNYVSNQLKDTGSNENWKAKNIFDIAGNLREWTNENASSGKYVIRDNGALQSSGGIFAGPSYRMETESYAFGDVGFRVALFLE